MGPGTGDAGAGPAYWPWGICCGWCRWLVSGRSCHPAQAPGRRPGPWAALPRGRRQGWGFNHGPTGYRSRHIFHMLPVPAPRRAMCMGGVDAALAVAWRCRIPLAHPGAQRRSGCCGRYRPRPRLPAALGWPWPSWPNAHVTTRTWDRIMWSLFVHVTCGLLIITLP